MIYSQGMSIELGELRSCHESNIYFHLMRSFKIRQMPTEEFCFSNKDQIKFWIRNISLYCRHSMLTKDTYLLCKLILTT